MRRVLESLVFLGLASALHAGVWVSFGAGAAPGSGAGGGAALTLQAGGERLAALVRLWEAPPEIGATIAAPPPMPEVPAPGTPPTAAEMPAPPPAPEQPALPAADRSPSARHAASPPLPPEAARPRPRPAAEATPGPAQPPQAAAGAARAEAAGPGGGGQTQARPPGTLRALEAEWGAAILARIARQQRYPAGNHGTGTARVTLSVGRDGRLRAVGLAASSGSAALDRAALDAVRRAGRFPPAPAGLESATYGFAVPMTFRRN